MKTITTSTPNGYEPGQLLSVHELDKRWWKRLWCFITLQPRPVIKTIYTIASIDSNTTITVK